MLDAVDILVREAGAPLLDFGQAASRRRLGVWAHADTKDARGTRLVAFMGPSGLSSVIMSGGDASERSLYSRVRAASAI